MPLTPEDDKWLNDWLGAQKAARERARGALEPAEDTAPAPAPTGGAKAAPSGGDDKGSQEEGWLSSIGGGIKSFGKEALKGAGAEIEGGLEFIPGYKDTKASQWLREHTEADPESGMAGTAGRFVGEMAPWMAIPEFGLAGRLGSLAAKAFPKTIPFSALGASEKATINAARKAAGQRALGGNVAVANPSELARLARTAAPKVGRGIEQAAAGAGAGAIADPEHPVKGAAVGSVAGLVPVSLGSLVRSPVMSHLAAEKARHVAGASAALAAHSVLGPLGMFAWPMVARGPSGRMINRGAHFLVDKAGKTVGIIPDSVLAALAGGAGGAASTAFAPGETTQGEAQ